MDGCVPVRSISIDSECADCVDEKRRAGADCLCPRNSDCDSDCDSDRMAVLSLARICRIIMVRSFSRPVDTRTSTRSRHFTSDLHKNEKQYEVLRVVYRNVVLVLSTEYSTRTSTSTYSTSRSEYSYE